MSKAKQSGIAFDPFAEPKHEHLFRGDTEEERSKNEEKHRKQLKMSPSPFAQELLGAIALEGKAGD